MTDPTTVEPPDNAGADTLARYRYQAHCAFSYCAEMLTNGGVSEIIAEHIEDIAIRRGSSWTFIQIKTMDGGLGPWRLSHALRPSGGLRSLWRAYNTLSQSGTTVTYELHLEGALDPRDAIHELLQPSAARSSNLCNSVAHALNASHETVSQFLALTTVRERPLRDTIRAKNIEGVGQSCGHLAIGAVSSVYDMAIETICQAFAGDLPSGCIPNFVADPNAATDDLKERIAARRLSAERLSYARMLFTSGIAELDWADVADVQPDDASALEQKLIAGGAHSATILTAKRLRATATAHEVRLLSSSIASQAERIEDVNNRLLVHARTIADLHRGQQNSAVLVFKGLLDSAGLHRDTIDPTGAFNKDPMLLVGQVCDLSDQCLSDWGAE